MNYSSVVRCKASEFNRGRRCCREKETAYRHDGGTMFVDSARGVHALTRVLLTATLIRTTATRDTTAEVSVYCNDEIIIFEQTVHYYFSVEDVHLA
jgi:hypothetical protein